MSTTKKPRARASARVQPRGRAAKVTRTADRARQRPAPETLGDRAAARDEATPRESLDEDEGASREPESGEIALPSERGDDLGEQVVVLRAERGSLFDDPDDEDVEPTDTSDEEA